MLSPEAASRYLLEHTLLKPVDVIAGNLRITNSSHRNQNMSVIASEKGGYFLKQGDTRQGVGTVDHEAQVYQWLHQYAGHSALLHYLPNYVSYEPSLQLLIVKYLDQSKDLRQYHTQLGKFPKGLAAQIGKLLAHLHQLAAPDTQQISLPQVKPWIFSICHPELEMFHSISKAALDLVKNIQRFQGFVEGLDQLYRSWHSQSLIHHDIKLDNFLLHRLPPSARSQSVKLIDWEFSGWGDPAWDVGSFFSSYLNFWVRSMPITEQSAPEECMQLARYPLLKIQKAIIPFWQAYCQGLTFDPTMHDSFLIKATQFAAARLLQSAFEWVMTTGQLTSNVICLMQLSLNLMTYPQAGVSALLGLSLIEDS